MSNNNHQLIQKDIRPLPKLINAILLNAGLTELEVSKYTVDRLMIANYLKPTMNVLEIGSRPSVSIFVELNKASDAKHIVVDNDVGDRNRLSQLIALNEMELKVMPIEEFVDIYSYDAVIIEESEGDTAELLKDLPLDKIGIIITSEMGKNRKSRAEVDSTLVSQGFEKTASATETTIDGEERVVDVYEKPKIESIAEDTVTESESISVSEDSVTAVEIIHKTEAAEPESIADDESSSVTEEVTIEVTEKEQVIVTPPNTPQVAIPPPLPVRTQVPVARRFVGRRRPMMRMGL